MEREPNTMRGRGQQEFEVREFVVPRFEAIIKSPPSIYFNEEGDETIQQIPIYICAK